MHKLSSGSLGRRFALAAAVLSAVIILLSLLGSFWLLSQQRTLALKALQEREASFHVKAASTVLHAMAERMSELAENPILVTGLVDSAGRETYLAPFLQGVRQIDGIPVEVVFTDFQGEEIARNGVLTFNEEQMAWLRRHLDDGVETSAVFASGGRGEVVAVELLRYSRTKTPEGALLYKFSLDDLRPSPKAHIAWEGEGAHPATPGSVAVLPIEVPQIYAPLGLKVVERLDDAGAALATPLPLATIAVMMLGLAALVYLLASRLAHALTRDLRRLEEFSSSLGDEDLSERRAELSGSDEVASLARSLNRMLDRLYRQQQLLRQENSKFYALANTIPQLAWMADPDGTATWYNERWYAYTGTSPEPMLGSGWTLVIDPARAEDVMKAWREALASGEPFQTTLSIRGADGANRPFFVSAAPLRNDEGRIVQWFGTCTDLSAIMQAEQAVHRSEERLQQGLVAGHMAVWDWRLADGRIGYAANLPSVFGQGFDDVDQAWRQVHEEDRPGLDTALADAAAGAGSYQITVRIERPGQAQAWVELRGKAVPGENGQPALMQAVAIDVSERKRAEEALQDADRRKDEFLAMLAHELRNPLAPISTAAQLLNMVFASEPRVKQASDIISRQVGHMTRLVDELLDVSRVTRGLVSLKKERLDLAQIVTGAVDQTRPLVEGRHHQLMVELPPEPVAVQGDLTRLIQVLANLLSNAARYTQESGRIEVRATAQPDTVQISVRDNGSGIDSALLPQVFDLFTQGKRTPDRSQGGLGVGLALVKKLVELHGGSVTAYSAGPGQGSEFAVTLPRAAAALPASSSPLSARAAPAGSLRILLVDDNADAADTLASVLDALGHRVSVCYRAGDALALAQRQDEAFDVFLLDIGLPDMDGHALKRQLEQAPRARGALYFALTGYGQEQDLKRSAEAGFDQHLVKPVNVSLLVELLAARAATADIQA